MAFFSINHIEASLIELRALHPFFGMTFLAFKQVGLPVGSTKIVNFANENRQILEAHYRPIPDRKIYYSPFHTAKTGWVSYEHPRTTLQRIAKDTFSDALIHPSGSNRWGWKSDYVSALKSHLRGKKIPAFQLAVWILRGQDWPTTISRERICAALFSKFDPAPTRWTVSLRCLS